MEYLELGDLSNYMMVSFPELEVRHLLSQLLDGLVFMHKQNYANRD